MAATVAQTELEKSLVQQTAVRQRLLQWREETVLKLGLNPDHPQWVVRNSIVLHDIFVDAIATSASDIHSIDDLRRVAYYWKWIEQYGFQVFQVIRDLIDVSAKRVDDFEEHYSYPRQKRVRCF